jgi:drug/metabolite transporter (DMT)-like permease
VLQVAALLASLVGHGLFFYLVQRHPMASVMPYLQLTPVLAGILLITLRTRQKTVPNVPAE